MKTATFYIFLATMYLSSTTTSTTANPTPPRNPPNLNKIYRLFNMQSGDHFYTAYAAESQGAQDMYGYTYQKVEGAVSTTPTDCNTMDTLIPVYRLYGNGDHFYTSNEAEAQGATAFGYQSESIAFYCSAAANTCGATLPLYRYVIGHDHFYTTDKSEGDASGGTYEGILCYIWPNLRYNNIYRLFNMQSGDHFYTAYAAESQGAQDTYGYTYQKVEGAVSTTPTDCNTMDTLIPVYRLYGNNEHFYTSSEAEAQGAMQFGYQSEGIAFYCSATPDTCGASLPLYRYASHRFYTTDKNEGDTSGGTYEGIVCYIWPASFGA